MKTLYYQDYCAYCQRVLDFATQNSIELELKNINIEENRAELVELGGKQQVPFLVDGDVKMYESEAIIAHLG